MIVEDKIHHGIIVRFIKDLDISEHFNFSEKENGSRDITFKGDVKSSAYPISYNITIHQITCPVQADAANVSEIDYAKHLSKMLKDITETLE